FPQRHLYYTTSPPDLSRGRGKCADTLGTSRARWSYTAQYSPNDAGMLDVVGFDTAAPDAIADFIAAL
ncbi:MAG: hypothetical protein RQ971_00705, partial [Armatimonadota bacterium]|nr:hypothetical protein [Armatimonadota bacterium]